MVLFEVYQGEVFKTGPTDLDAVDEALTWLDVIETSAATARAAAALQDEFRTEGEPLAARDAYIAGSAALRDKRLVVADADFNADGITGTLDVDFV